MQKKVGMGTAQIFWPLPHCYLTKTAEQKVEWSQAFFFCALLYSLRYSSSPVKRHNQQTWSKMSSFTRAGFICSKPTKRCVFFSVQWHSFCYSFLEMVLFVGGGWSVQFKDKSHTQLHHQKQSELMNKIMGKLLFGAITASSIWLHRIKWLVFLYLVFVISLVQIEANQTIWLMQLCFICVTYSRTIVTLLFKPLLLESRDCSVFPLSCRETSETFNHCNSTSVVLQDRCSLLHVD